MSRLPWRRTDRRFTPRTDVGRALLRVTADHMCPECGILARTFCPVCHGRGMITSLELDVWQKRQDEILGPEPAP